MKVFIKSSLVVLITLSMCGFCAENTLKIGNDRRCRSAVESIGAMSHVCDAAVLCREKTVLAAVFLDVECEKTDGIADIIERMLRRIFYNSEEFIVEVNSGVGVDVLELAYYMESDISKRILNERFSDIAGASCNNPRLPVD